MYKPIVEGLNRVCQYVLFGICVRKSRREEGGATAYLLQAYVPVGT
jgi:hypothetical protein